MHAAFLFIAILLPLAGGIGIYFIQNHVRLRRIYTLAVTLLTTLLVWLLILNRPSGSFILLQFTQNLNISFTLDGLGCLFAGMISCLWPLVTLYAFEYMEREHRQNSFFMFFTMTYGITLGVALSANMLTMYLFYELLTLVTLPLVIHELGHDAMYAGRKYLYFSLGGSALAFLGLVFVIVYSGSTAFVLGGDVNPSLGTNRLSTLLIVYVISFMGFGVKAAVFPLHSWLPTAGVAPTPVTALLHAVAVVKAGVFAITRLTYYCYGTELLAGTWAQYTVMGLVIFTILFGSSMALKERHFKRRLAYSTVSNLSYILFGITMMNPIGMAAGLLHLLFHSVMKILGFLSAGSAIHKSGREYIFQLDGLGRKMPVTFAALTIAGLGLTGIPLFAGFISKWQLAEAALQTGGVLPLIGVCILLLSALLTALYMLSISIRAFFSPLQMLPGLPIPKESGWRMLLPLCLFAVLVLVMGIHPQPFLRLVSAIAQGTF
ncbi:MAG: proton-conducting membrane transporter [Lachnospiraceae bacterium]|jgi:multicomponent Na+:H+ antiporter subunit D|nr:proton-conducting membrane transporter [Lachnospiraceae bacterium]